VIATLAETARTYVFTTAAPPLRAEALRASLAVIRGDAGRHAHLAALVERFRRGMEPLPWRLLPSATPIQPLVVGDNAAAVALSQALWQRGFWVPAIRPPTVPAGRAAADFAVRGARRRRRRRAGRQLATTRDDRRSRALSAAPAHQSAGARPPLLLLRLGDALRPVGRAAGAARRALSRPRRGPAGQTAARRSRRGRSRASAARSPRRSPHPPRRSR
jgi:hypothetical protein